MAMAAALVKIVFGAFVLAGILIGAIGGAIASKRSKAARDAVLMICLGLLFLPLVAISLLASRSGELAALVMLFAALVGGIPLWISFLVAVKLSGDRTSASGPPLAAQAVVTDTTPGEETRQG